MSHMAPDQFVMWLRGVLDAVGEGEAIPAATVKKVNDQLTDAVGGLVAARMRSAAYEQQMREAKTPQVIASGRTGSSYNQIGDETAMKIEELRYQKDIALAQMKLAAQK